MRDEKRICIRWGNVPIPEAHVVGTGVGIALDILYPLRTFAHPWINHVAGWPVLIAGILLAGWAVITAGSVDVEAPTKLISTGPYAFSRNPMYVAWTLIVLGTALLINTLWILLMLPLIVLYTHFFVILREEERLKQQFGEVYREYYQTVRRYC